MIERNPNSIGSIKHEHVEAKLNAPSRLEKHADLYEAICRVKSINSHLNDLYSRIVGNDINPEEKTVSHAEITLANVLNDGGEMLLQQIDEAHNQIEEISRTLF